MEVQDSSFFYLWCCMSRLEELHAHQPLSEASGLPQKVWIRSVSKARQPISVSSEEIRKVGSGKGHRY